MKTLKPVDLIRLNIEIEHRIGPGGDLFALAGKEPLLLSVSRCADGHVTFFRHDIPAEVRHDILALDPDQALNDRPLVQQILTRYRRCTKAFAARAYFFAHVPSAQESPEVEFERGCYVVKMDGVPVAWAWSQDSSARADELAVETLPPFRRRGLARQAAVAWAAAVIGAGRVAFYTHAVGNVGSEALALSLGVQQYALTTGYS